MAITNFAHWSAYRAEHVKTINALLTKWRIPPNDWKKTLKGKGKWSRAQWAEGKTIPDTNRPCVSGELHIDLATPFDAPILFNISLSPPPTPIITHTLGWCRFPCGWGQAWTVILLPTPPQRGDSRKYGLVQLVLCWGSKPGLGQCLASLPPPLLTLQVISLSEGFSLSLFALPILC